MPFLLLCEQGLERIIPLEKPEVVVGRKDSADIELATKQCSRAHCKLLMTPQGAKVVDLESTNGTFVNGVRVQECELKEGDRISVGEAALIFLKREPVGFQANGVGESTQSIPIEDRNVRLLLSTIVAASGVEDMEIFLRLAVDNLVEIADAEHGILYLPEPGGALAPRISRSSQKEDLAHLEDVSHSIPRKAFETGQAVFMLDTAEGNEAALPSSIQMHQIRTVMCAPLQLGERRLGVMYVDSHAKRREYSATDLALFEAIVKYLAVSLVNVQAWEVRRREFEAENYRLREALGQRRHVMGESPAMMEVYDRVQRVAPAEASVLLLGESGTGKEVLAKLIHELSPRAKGPFVVIDCAAIPETLMESELFGYERGAFTGAVASKPGKFELSQGGTLFLDEIGEMPLSMQVKLLRVLEQREVMRVGGTGSIRVDTRILAATNRDLAGMVQQGKFRQDLFYRLNVVAIHVPALRERGTDIGKLADAFLGEAAEVNRRPVRGFAPEAREALLLNRWEGNVRELRHRIEQAVLMTNGEFLTARDMGFSGETPSLEPLERAREAFEREYLARALARNQGNVSATARMLDISRQHMQTLMKKFNLRTQSEGA